MSLSIPSENPPFSSLGLSEHTLRALDRAGFQAPTPIQARAIPLALTGGDVIGCAATGTGKTAAFALPMIERLAGKGASVGLVLAPTRELANQIAETFAQFGHPRGVKCATLIGGVGMGDQVRAIKSGAQVLVATPGRLIDHLDQGSVRLDGIQILVLDEADRMLDMGFKPQLTKILARLPKARQTLLFSATMAGEVSDFARTHLKNPAKVEVARSGTTAARAVQQVFLLDALEKTPTLLALLAEDEDSTLVFTRTKRRADRIARSLERKGHKVSRIHADRSQKQREQALEGFRTGRYRVLVATDIAARGIDVAEIGHVVNYDLPHVPEDYVHRIGRTARAAASGRASSFASPEELPLLRDIEKYTRSLVPRGEVPRSSPVFQAEHKLSQERQKDPGPPQRNHGVSGRPANKQPGRHARTHPKPHAHGKGAGQPSGGGEGSAASSTGATVFRGGPRRRR